MEKQIDKTSRIMFLKADAPTILTVASELQDEVLRKDWPKMSDDAFEHAIRLAAFVGRAMCPELEDENAETLEQYFVSFVAMRRALPRNVMMNLAIVGPKLWDFMNVITQVSGLSVIQVNDGLWFFDMRNRLEAGGGYVHRKFNEQYATITPETVIPQFVTEPEEGEVW